MLCEDSSGDGGCPGVEGNEGVHRTTGKECADGPPRGHFGKRHGCHWGQTTRGSSSKQEKRDGDPRALTQEDALSSASVTRVLCCPHPEALGRGLHLVLGTGGNTEARAGRGGPRGSSLRD